MREQLRVLLRAAERLDPLGCRAVLLSAPRARDLVVGDVADEDVAERVLGLAGDGGVLLAADELLALQRVQPLLHRPPGEPGDLRERSHPDDLAQDGGVLEHVLFLAAVSASSRAAMIPWMDSGAPPASSRPRSCTIRTYSSAYSGFPPARASSADWSSAGSTERSMSRRDQLRRLALGERRERDRRRVALPAAPAGAPLQQLGTGGAHAEERDAAGPLDEVVDEIEQAVVRPLQVVEDEDERPSLRERLEELPPRCEDLGPPVAAELRLRRQARRAARGVRAPSRRRSDRRSPRRPPRGASARPRSAPSDLEDRRMRLDHLAQRPERDSLAVGQRPSLPPVDELGILVHDASTARTRASTSRSRGRRRASRAAMHALAAPGRARRSAGRAPRSGRRARRRRAARRRRRSASAARPLPRPQPAPPSPSPARVPRRGTRSRGRSRGRSSRPRGSRSSAPPTAGARPC